MHRKIFANERDYLSRRTRPMASCRAPRNGLIACKQRAKHPLHGFVNFCRSDFNSSIGAPLISIGASMELVRLPHRFPLDYLNACFKFLFLNPSMKVSAGCRNLGPAMLDELLHFKELLVPFRFCSRHPVFHRGAKTIAGRHYDRKVETEVFLELISISVHSPSAPQPFHIVDRYYTAAKQLKQNPPKFAKYLIRIVLRVELLAREKLERQ